MQNREIRVDIDKVKRLASEHEISIYALEKEAGLTNGTIRKWDKAIPNLKSLFGVAEILGIDFWKLTIIQ